MLEILGLITLAYLAFGALLSFSPLMRDVFCIEFSSRNPADKWKIRVARMIGHLGMVLAWPGLLAAARQNVIAEAKDLIRAIRRTLHSYWQPNTIVRFALTLEKEAEMGVKSSVRPARTRSFASDASENTPKVNPSGGDKQPPQERVFYKEWKVATCPSSNHLRLLCALSNGVSGPSMVEVKLPFGDASSGAAGWFCA